MVTILEALQNAEINLVTNRPSSFGVDLPLMLGKDQIHNAIVLLEKGYSPHDSVEDTIGEGTVEDVPDKE